MEAKKLLKKHLDIQIPKGEYRSEKQLTQLRNDACIDAINEALSINVVIVSDFCECDGVQDLHAMTGVCRKCGKECTY